MDDLKKRLNNQQKLTHELRKQYLKEINNMREAHSQGHEKFKDSLQVTFFDVAEGIDKDTTEILNLKLSDLRRQFLHQLEEKNNVITFQSEQIHKYKKLAPKSKYHTHILILFQLFEWLNCLQGKYFSQYLWLSKMQ